MPDLLKAKEMDMLFPVILLVMIPLGPGLGLLMNLFFLTAVGQNLSAAGPVYGYR